MKKTFLIGLIPLLIAFMSMDSFGRDALSGPRIVLEEEEITVLENGKEVETVRTSRDEKGAIIAEARKKGRLITVRDLDQPKLKFIDDNRTVYREIPLGYSKEETIISYPRDGEIQVERKTIRRAIVSKNKKYAAVTENINEAPVVRESQRFGNTVGGTRGILNYYNAAGKTIWTKQTPENMSIENAAVSADGEIIAYVQVYVMGGLKAGEPFEKLSVIDKSGQIIFDFPTEKYDGYRLEPGPTLLMSDNGRYIAVSGVYMKTSIELFFDTSNKSLWAAHQKYTAYKISDDGVASLSAPDLEESDPKSVDIKKYLGGGHEK